MLKLFLNRSRGSITVMVTLMLIPTIFFTGFLTDLARIKLSSNQAVMAADNYGEAILTEYDYLLKELYGLFAISQSDEGKQAIKDLQKYMQTSFNPSSNTIIWDHLAGATGFLSGNFEGCMPYQNAQVEMDFKMIDSSKLSSQQILSTQIGDFMRFRIIQEFMDDNVQATLLNALEQGQNAERDSVVLDRKEDFDNAVGKLMAEMKNYYEVLQEINHYPEYISNINAMYEITKKKFLDIVNSDSYQRYRKYIDNKEAIEAARKVKKDDRTEEDEELIEIGEEYDKDSNARAGKLRDKFESAIGQYEASRVDDIINFDNFVKVAKDLQSKAMKVQSAMQTAKEQRDRLEVSLANNITEDLKKEIKENIKIFDELLSSEYASQCYINLAQKVLNNSNVNSDYQLKMQGQIERLEQIVSDYLAEPAVDKISEYKDKLDKEKYDNFQKYSQYRNLYDKLKKMFQGGDSDKEKQAQEKKDNANKAKNDAEKELNEKETTDARSIPDAIPIGDKEEGSGLSIANLIKSASSYFQMNSFGEAGNKLLLKFYMSAYDYGMFSNRVTNVRQESKSNKEMEDAVSLTGIEMCKSVNYLYQAEMEYLYGGHKDSAANLNAAKDSILAFRTVVNMTSTYTVKEINNAIKGIRQGLVAIGQPILAIIVEAALRLGITAVETAADWKKLKAGEEVMLVKKEIGDLEAFDIIKGFLPEMISGDKKSDGIKLDYGQYLLVMITFLRTSEQIAARTGDLITLNVNTVQLEIGEEGTLKELAFKLNEAYTAVEASCTVHIDFVVMPDNFAQKAIDDTVYNSLAEYERNRYKFTVARGY